MLAALVGACAAPQERPSTTTEAGPRTGSIAATATTATSLPRRTESKLCVFVGGAHLDEVTSFENWLGRPVGPVLVFIDEHDLSESAGVIGPLGPHRAIWSPDLPDIRTVAAGRADGVIRRFLQELVARGQADSVLRPYWEFNGSWMSKWYSEGRTATFVAAWRRFVEVARSVPHGRFTVEWAPNVGDDAAVVEASYPGDDVVDYIGLDVYDQDWTGDRLGHIVDAPIGLAWQRDFAAAHRKKRAFGEWGLVVRRDGHGGGDDPAFIDLVGAEMSAPDVEYGCYFEYDAPDGEHRLRGTRFPQAAERFRARFGSA